jgi:hypothetical protein
MQCGVHEKETGFPWIFQKESTFNGKSYYEKEEGGPYSFVQVSVYRKSGKWIQNEPTRKKSVYRHQSSKTVFMNTVKKCQLILSRLFPAFLCFEHRLFNNKSQRYASLKGKGNL